jgi:glyoxylase-like metal-dependent hydrolase (beta-lactamase superfamily II)
MHVRTAFCTAIAALTLIAAAPAGDPAPAFPVKLISGGDYSLDKQPDGNTIVFEDAAGLVVVDTGRHVEHQAKILDYAKERGKPITAIVNTHWHLDHAGGNAEIRAVFPQAKLYTSNAISGALDGFLANSLRNAEARLADPKTTEEQKTAIRLGVDAMRDRRNLIPDMPVVTGKERLALGRERLDLHLARWAATEGDTWIYHPASKTLVAGDLVVIPAPFFDTGCAKGWRAALEEIAELPFLKLIPGHGPELTRQQFDDYHKAFRVFTLCVESDAPKQQCVDGWKRDAWMFLPDKAVQATAQALLDYYIDQVLRVPAKQAELCGPVAKP